MSPAKKTATKKTATKKTATKKTATKKTATKKTATKKTATKKTATKKTATKKTATKKAATKKTATKKTAPKLLSGGNPQIAKGEGDAVVEAYLAALPGWKAGIGRRIDALVVESVPKVRKAVKWNTPFYGVDDQGFFLGFHCFVKYVKVTFFRGTSMKPVPPGTSKQAEVRYLDIYEEGFDENQFKSWVKQAASLPPEKL